MFAGDTVELHGVDGSVSLVNYRGPIDSQTACVVSERGMQFSIPTFRLKAIPKPAPKIEIGDMVEVKGDFGVVEDVQGMFFIVRVDDRVEHFHRSEVKSGY